MSSGTTTDAGSVLIESDVSDPVEAILNRPMLAAEGENALGAGPLGCSAGDAIDSFGAEFLRNHFCGFALDGEDLSGMRKVDVTVQLGAGPDAPYFDPAVAFIGRGVLRGEMTPVSNRRCLDEESADCL